MFGQQNNAAPPVVTNSYGYSHQGQMDYGGYNQGQYGQQQSSGIETGTSYGAVGQPVQRRGRGRGRLDFL